MALTAAADGWGFHPAAREETKQDRQAGARQDRIRQMLQIPPDSRQIGYEVDGWVGDRPSARCIPSHDRHDLMNITEAMPGCQSTLVTQSRDRQSQQLSQQQGEVTSQYTSKKSAGPGKWQLDKPGQGSEGRHDKDDGGRGLAFVPSQSVSHTHQSAHPAPAIGAPTPTGLVDPR